MTCARRSVSSSISIRMSLIVLIASPNVEADRRIP
jgi:hypothetical protein